MKHPEIILETSQFLALNKVPGLLTIPDRFDGDLPSLKKLLESKYGEIFTVHRLDRETSGIILFAKNKPAHQFYSKQFENRKVGKQYLGMVEGNLSMKKGTIELPIAEHPHKKGKMMISAKGKPALTHYEVLEEFSLYSWARFDIETGRTHQIRVHMKHIGNPLLCDELYGNGNPVFVSSFKRNFKRSALGEEERPLLSRLGLHSWKLMFQDENGNSYQLEAELPKDLKALLQQLRKWKK